MAAEALSGRDVSAKAPGRSWRLRWPAFLPPARLTWITLAILGAYEANYLGGLGVASLIGLPIVAVVVDLIFQRVRFAHLRVPDAAIVTGLFLALLFPPTAPLLLTGSVTFAAVGLRHALRFKGRPWFNPAAAGVVLGTLFLGLAPAWWVGIGPDGELAMVVLGALLVARTPSSWRLPAMFLLTYSLLSVVQHVFVGASTDPQILLLQAIDPATVFFALFMVPEPRSSPGAAHQQVLFAGVVGIAAAFLPLVLPTLGVLVSLLGGNVLAVLLRRAPRAVPQVEPSPRSAKQTGRARRAATRAEKERPRPSVRWPIAYRVAAAVLVLVVLGGVVSADQSPHAAAPVFKVTAPTAGGGSGVSTACASDNATIASSTLSSLHKLLGPSVILNYDSQTGIVVFYDPVNHVTVTESDLYEDYGFAEFNGDDYAVSGCAP